VSAYAVIKTGGKQVRVAQDDLIVVEKLVGEAGDAVSFDDVLMLVDGDTVKIGEPTVAGVAVQGEITDQRRAKKIIVFKKKRRQNYRRKRGHRQFETVVRITGLGGVSAKPKAAKTAAPKAEPKAGPKTEAPKADAGDLPVLFLDAPNGAADDLKKIGGVGPAIEKKLNALGVYHFAQIAAFTPDDIAKVDEVLNFKGRIDREGWLEQAGKLAKGEE